MLRLGSIQNIGVVDAAQLRRCERCGDLIGGDQEANRSRPSRLT